MPPLVHGDDVQSRRETETNTLDEWIRESRSHSFLRARSIALDARAGVACIHVERVAKRVYVAGHGTNAAQSVDERKSSSGGNGCLNVNAKCDGPCSCKCASRFFASSTLGV